MTGLEPQDAAALLVGESMAATRAVADAPSLVLTDGPSGVAMNLPDFSGKVPATSFPAPVALAASWDTTLVEEVARAIGTEARAAGADILLGPSINIKRSPLGGRNFEYYSEDPLLAGRVGAAFVRGVQSAGVGACLKHFAVNSQETDRMRVSAEVEEKALREIYLPAFEHVVTTARPAMVMASYNRLNGVYAAEHPWLLTQVLRREWGFDGSVVSDWGAVDDPVASVAAGLDLQMPGPADAARDAIDDAVRAGVLDVQDVLDAGARVRATALRWAGGPRHTVDEGRHAALARRAATGSMVLLRNAGAVLPLADDGAPLLVVGELARAPQTQGGGSAHVEPGEADSPLSALRASRSGETLFEQGYSLDGPADAEPAGDARAGTALADVARAGALADAAVERAASSGAVVVVVGPGRSADSEGYDRETLDLPADQVDLVRRLGRANPRTVVVVNAGGVVAMDAWHEHVAAVVHMWLPGNDGAGAVAEILTGRVNPSGRLPETFPVALQDTPTWPSFPARHGRALHGEGSLVGYRWYDRAGAEVSYPFGHGLGYTSFAYDDLVAVEQGESVVCTFTLTNTGRVRGAEVWQAYCAGPRPGPTEAVRRLAAFGKVDLAPGEQVTVTVELDHRSFAVWDEATRAWAVHPGTHVVHLGASSRDLRASVAVARSGDVAPADLRADSSLREWVSHPQVGPRLLEEVRRADPTGASEGFLTNPTVLTMIGDMPISRLVPDPHNALSPELLARACTVGDGSAGTRRPQSPPTKHP